MKGQLLVLLTFITDLKAELFGAEATDAHIVASFIFVLMGAFLNFYIEVRRRNKYSDNTPFYFSWKFLIGDNGWRIFGTLVMSFMFVCMGPNLIVWLSDYVKIPEVLAHFSPFFLGIGGDYVPMLLKQKIYKSKRIVLEEEEISKPTEKPDWPKPTNLL